MQQARAQEARKSALADRAPPEQNRRRRLEALRAIGRQEDGHRVYPGPETVALIHSWGERGGFSWVPGADPGILVHDQRGRMIEHSTLARWLLTP